MIALIQRVVHAHVDVGGQRIGAIDEGVLALLGVEKEDTEAKADRMLQRLLGYRIFEDEAGKMNLSLQQINGGLLLVPQFTLPADTRKGMRPSFTPAAPPAEGERLFLYLLQQAKENYILVANGQFGADMQVGLTNNGPVTFWLQV